MRQVYLSEINLIDSTVACIRKNLVHVEADGADNIDVLREVQDIRRLSDSLIDALLERRDRMRARLRMSNGNYIRGE